ncbi:hypothetical protein [Muricoccus radiodurans]|uniref:hypothetical protein n=1 Tax=Muricoccus radiodurans TaxID=2231721 RepID=UPI003CFA1999
MPSNDRTFPGAHARLHRNYEIAGYSAAWTVMLAGEADRATPDALVVPGQLSALLTFDDGFSWPDADGIALARATLERGGVVAMAFASIADALACLRRLHREAGQ